MPSSQPIPIAGGAMPDPAQVPLGAVPGAVAIDSPFALPRVLVVEDDNDHFQLLQFQLETERPPTDISRAVSLSDARAQAENGVHDVVVLDLGLPESRGMATLRAALEFLDGTPVIVLTAQNDTEFGLNTIAAGAVDFVDKQSLATAGLARRILFARERFETRRAVERQNRFLRTFVASVGHDLKSPPRQIAQIADMIGAEMEEPTADIASLLARIRERAGHLGHLLDRTLDYALQAAREPACATFRVGDLVAEVCRDLDEAEAARVALSTDATIFADRSLMFLVLHNLIGNGLKYWRGTPSTVTVAAESGTTGAAIRVRDTGIGIPAALAPHVFDPTVRAVPGAEFAGTGFGLSIVKLLVEAHGGEVSLASEDGAGTEVTIRLPLSPPRL